MTTVSRFTEAFWTGLTNGDLRLPDCENCAARFFPPTPSCPHCGSPEVTWTTVPPDGSLYSFTRVHRAAPGFDTPRVLGQLTLDAGPRLFGVIDAPFDTLTIGDRARVEPVEYTDEYDRGPLADTPYYHIVPTSTP